MFFVLLLPLLVLVGAALIVGPVLLPVAVVAAVAVLVVHLYRHHRDQAVTR